MKGVVLALGASSTIAQATCRELAAQGYGLFLAGRDVDELERLSSDLHIRYQVPVYSAHFDAQDTSSHPQFLQNVIQTSGELEGVLLAFGYLGHQFEAQTHFREAESILQCNFVGACSILSECANYLELRRKGFIIGISSVAGDRGRRSNYFYGAAKGGLTLFLQGLRARLFPAGVQVMTVKPGFVDTGMTYGKAGMFLVAPPTKVAKQIVKGLNRGTLVLYTPYFWRYIMWIINMIPETLFRRLSL